MHESELNRLASPDDLISEEVVFEVVGLEVVVMDTVLAEAIHGLSKGDQAIVLLYYFAEWTDRRIAEELGCPRSTVQFRRSKALLALRARLEEVIGEDELGGHGRGGLRRPRCPADGPRLFRRLYGPALHARLPR